MNGLFRRAFVGLTAGLLMSGLVGSATLAASPTYSLGGNTPGFIKHAADLGAVPSSTTMTVTVWLKLHNEARLDKLVQGQQTRGSASYRKWLNQAQFDGQFSPTAAELDSVTSFLTSHGLSVVDKAENNFYVKVQGSAAAIQKTFHVALHKYLLDGKTYRSNTGNPSVSDGSGANIAAVTGLDDYGYSPNVEPAVGPDGQAVKPVAIGSNPNGFFFESQCFTAPESHTFTSVSPAVTASYTGNRFGADIGNNSLGHLAPCGYQPSEMQTAYNLGPLYTAGLDGTGETVVITDAFGSSTIAGDAEVFSEIYGLPDITPANFQIVRAGGIANSPKGPSIGWDGETTLDVEWVHALAPGAKIVLLQATDRASLDEAINYAVVHHLGNTISNSWSIPEGLGNPAQFIRVNRILQMAAAEGIDVNFATGDNGDELARTGITTVDFPASSPYATGIGGTSIALNPDDSIKWQSGWGTNLTRIANNAASGFAPIDPPSKDPALGLGFQFGAGGGTSLTFAKPAFQASLPGNKRMVPDISMLADPFTGAEIIETIGGQLSFTSVGGTSLSTPMFSAVMAIAAQKAGHGLGQAAALVYGLSGSAIDDIVPVGSATNVTGTIVDSSGTTNYSADQLAAPLSGTSTYYSAFYNSPFSTRWFVITFGTDTALRTAAGWDNVTGVGAPGANFVNAIAP